MDWFEIVYTNTREALDIAIKALVELRRWAQGMLADFVVEWFSSNARILIEAYRDDIARRMDDLHREAERVYYYCWDEKYDGFDPICAEIHGWNEMEMSLIELSVAALDTVVAALGDILDLL